jgi:hypothetical protein
MHRSWFPPEVHINTGRLCSAGSGHNPVPRRPRSYAALRLPRFLRRKAPVFPCLPPTSARTLVLCLAAGNPCVRRRVARRRFLSGSPCCRFLPRRNVGLPGSWAVLFLRAKVVHPAGCALPSPTSIASKSLLPSGKSAPSASGLIIDFVAAVPRPARSRAYASPAALPRPSQGLLPAGAVTPSPDGFRTRWTTYRIS